MRLRHVSMLEREEVTLEEHRITLKIATVDMPGRPRLILYDAPEVHAYRDLDDPNVVIVLTIDRKYEIVNMGIYDTRETRVVEGISPDLYCYGSGWEWQKFRVLDRDHLREIVVERAPMPDMFTTRASFEDAFGRSSGKALDWLRGLAPHTMVRKLVWLLDELGA